MEEAATGVTGDGGNDTGDDGVDKDGGQSDDVAASTVKLAIPLLLLLLLLACCD